MHTEAMIQLIANLHPDDVIDFEERSAIAEYDGKLSREDAERLALELVMAKRIKGGKIER